MKFTQRLDYARLAEVLAEREMVDLAALQELLQASNEGGQAFPEALIEATLVADWDLSRIVCEVFHLAFLPVDQLKPDKALLELFHPQLLHNTGLVPITRFGNVLTLAMPALVSADILAMMSAETDMILLPVVGTVTGNRRWLKENCKLKSVTEEKGWGSLFDEAEKAVQQDLGADDTAGLFSMGDMDLGLTPAPGTSENLDLGLGNLDSGGFDFDAPEDVLESTPSLMGSDLEFDMLDPDPDLEVEGAVGAESDSDSEDLPPMPEFG
ncbi:MAG: hypothetical protein R3F17_04690 [Planctomycetota bacterium]